MNDPYEKNVGPLISFDKSYLCMMAEVCKIKQDQGKNLFQRHEVWFKYYF